MTEKNEKHEANEIWFDAHLDLAHLAVGGRDMLRTVAELDAAGHDPATDESPQPPGVTVPELLAGGVTTILGTIFTAPDYKAGSGYVEGDAESAHAAGLRQLEWYEGLRGRVFTDFRGEPQPGKIRLGILIENADPIRAPEELAWWVERGVVAVGLTWNPASRYAGGCATDQGLTPLGRELLAAMEHLDVVLDLSHLSQQATDEALETFGGRVMASHSNARSRLGGHDNQHWQRHLADETIREIGRRDGVVGLNLAKYFVRYLPRESWNDTVRPEIDEAIALVEHVVDLHGHTQGVGLGSDWDGGFSRLELPAGLERPVDLAKLTARMTARGWTAEALGDFQYGNWAGFFGV